MRFQLTRLMRGVTLQSSLVFQSFLFQLTRLMRGVTSSAIGAVELEEISTHTPHARRDVFLGAALHYLRISTHTPHARRDWSSVQDIL